MNRDRIITLTNRISVVVILLLLYWVFIFTAITVFGFKVFRENITESFYLSIIGILALLGGAVIVNVMFNLTRISDALSESTGPPIKQKKRRKPVLITFFFLSFPAIFLLLYWGDVRTSGAKEKFLVKSGKYMVSNNAKIIDQLADYSFDSAYVESASSYLKLLSKEDESFRAVQLILQDTVNGKVVFLKFGGYFGSWEKNNDKADYIFACSKDEREYLKKVFEERSAKYRFSASNGSYELYYPVKTDKRVIVLYFTDRKQYGKLGS